MDHLPLRFGRRLPSKRRPSGEHLVEQDAERIDVRGRPDRSCLSDHLLRGHVARSPEPRTAQRQGLPFVEVPRQPEIGDLGRAIGREQDVGRLQVAVHDPAPVCHLHGLGQLGQQRRRLASRLGCARDGLSQVAPFQELHREKWAALMLAHIVDLHDVRVAQLRHHLRFALEPRPFVRSGVRAGLQHLQSDHAVQAQVQRLVNDAHSAAPQHRLDLVAANLGKPTVQRRRGPRCGSRRWQQRVDLGLQLAKAHQAITDLGQQFRAGPTHLLRCATRFEDLLEQPSHAWIGRHDGILPTPWRTCLCCGMPRVAGTNRYGLRGRLATGPEVIERL